MSDPQRYALDWSMRKMAPSITGEFARYEPWMDDAQAENARLTLRVADLEIAEPVSAVLADQVLDVICGIGDCEIRPHMDPRRHPVYQCLIAAILDNARLRDFVRLVREEWNIHTPPRITEALKKMDAPDA